MNIYIEALLERGRYAQGAVATDLRALAHFAHWMTRCRLTAAQIDAEQFDLRTQQKLPRYPVPCFRMSRLATHAHHRGSGLGGLLVGCAIERCLEARKQVGAYALVVDAKGDEAKNFYTHYGFTACRDHPMTRYLPLGLGA